MKTSYKLLLLAVLLMTFCMASARKTYIGPNAVDLGLSVLWGDKNMQDVSLNTLYFYWAQTSNGGNGMTLVGTDEEYPDNICGTQYDVATEYYGDGWRMPTADEFRELYEKCSSRFASDGVTFTAANGNSITLGLVGYIKNGTNTNDYSYYWTGTKGNPGIWSPYISQIGFDSNTPTTTYQRYAPDAFGFNSSGLKNNDKICDYLYSNQYQCAIRPVKDVRKAYAVLNNGELTFYFDDKKDSRTGTKYGVNTAYYIAALRIPSQMPEWYADREKIKKATFDSSFANFRATATTLWFYDCTNMTSINGLKNLNMENVTDTRLMFYNCQSLATLDLSSFNTSKVAKTSSMFNKCSKLTTIYASDLWTMDAVTESGNMFYDCTKLVGGKGTKFSSVHIDKEYAHIDGGVVSPGYLTLQKNSEGSSVIEAYAVLNDGVLTFYYDGLKSTRMGDKFAIGAGSRPTWYNERDNVTEVRFDSSFEEYFPTTTECWFVCKNLTSIKNLCYLNTSKVTNMVWMFGGSSKLVSIDLSKFNTENVTDMNHMFYNCKNLNTIDVSTFNTSKVTDMEAMFDMVGVEKLDLSNFNTSNVINMRGMFSGSTSLKAIDMSNFNTSNVTHMGWMFHDCNLISLDLSSFNTTNVTNMHTMFQKNPSLTTIKVSTKWSISKVTDGGNMFQDCPMLVGSMGTKYNSNHVDLAYAHVDGGTSNPGYLTLITPASSEATQAYVVLNNGKLTFYYDNKRNSRSGLKYTIKDDYRYYDDGDFSNRFPAWTSPAGNSSITSAVFDSSFGSYRPKNTVCWFFCMPYLTSITGMQYLNTSEVTDMSAMFRYCSTLPTVDVTYFDTRNVTDMSFLFCCCDKLKTIDVSKFNTAKVTNMKHMFHGCTPLTKLDVSNFNTANVTDMSIMFAELTSLLSLDLSKFNTAKVVSMYAMFAACSKLKSLNLKSFNSSKVVKMSDMFVGCTTLKTIYASDKWTNSAVVYGGNMFTGCEVLVGGMGTKYDAAHVDYDYARIDEGRCNPGYFTDDTSTAALGPKEAYAALADGVLTFYYDSFKECTDGKIFPIEQNYTSSHLPAWHEDRSQIIAGAFDSSFADYRPTNTSYWFYELEQMTALNDAANLKTLEVTKMENMFYSCKKLAVLDVSGFNTAKVTTMYGMFCSCQSLTVIDVSKFNTANVASMAYMFKDCEVLEKLDLCG